MKKWLSILINCLTFILPIFVGIILIVFTGLRDIEIIVFNIAALILIIPIYFVLTYLRGKIIGKILAVLIAVSNVFICLIFTFLVQDSFDMIKDQSVFVLGLAPCSLFCLMIGFYYYVLFGGVIGSVGEAISNTIIFFVSYWLGVLFALFGKDNIFLLEYLPLIVLSLAIIPATIIFFHKKKREDVETAYHNYLAHQRWLNSLSPAERKRYEEEETERARKAREKWQDEWEAERERDEKWHKELEEKRAFEESLKPPTAEDVWGNKYEYVEGYGNKKGYWKSNNVNHRGIKFHIENDSFVEGSEEDDD